MNNSTSHSKGHQPALNRWALIRTLVIFVGMLVPVLVLPTFQFIVYVTNNFEKFKNRHFASFLSVELLKYLFVLLAIIVNVDSIDKSSPITVNIYLYFHFATFLWLRIISRLSLNVIRNYFVPATKSRSSLWLQHRTAIPVALVAPLLLIAAIHFISQTFANRYCSSDCFWTSHFVCFQSVKLFLLLLCTIDLAWGQYYRARGFPQTESDSEMLRDLDLVNFNFVLCCLFWLSCVAETIGFMVFPNRGVILTIVSLVEAWGLALMVIVFRKLVANVKT